MQIGWLASLAHLVIIQCPVKHTKITMPIRSKNLKFRSFDEFISSLTTPKDSYNDNHDG